MFRRIGLLVMLGFLVLLVRAQKHEFTSLEEALKFPDDVFILDLSDQGLKEIPKEIAVFKDLQELIIERNVIKELPEELFLLPNLMVLRLSHHSIEEVPSAIGKLQNLHTIDLSNGQIKKLPNELGKLKMLSDLNLSNNKNLVGLPGEIGGADNLRTIDISNTGIQFLPSSIRKLKMLKSLNLSNNNLSKIPEMLVHRKSLEVLDLRSNKIEKIPKYIHELQNLKQLWLSNNDIIFVSPAVGSLSKLEMLDLSDNKISVLPSEIGNLSALKSLDVSYNDIHELPITIAGLISLETLDLSNNSGLQSIPPEIGKLSKLSNMYLAGSDNVVLPDEILGIQLENIDFNTKFDIKRREFYDRQLENERVKNNLIVASILLVFVIIVVLLAYLANRASKRKLQQAFNELKKTQEQLVQAEKMASLGTLVSRVAHEINTPVGVGVTTASSLTNMSKVIKKLYEEGNMKRSDLEVYFKDSVDACGLILRNMYNAHQLIRSFKQVSVDQITDEKRKFDLINYLKDIITSIQPKLNPNKVSVKITGQNHIEMESYPGVWSQIIINLALNSLTHAFKGIKAPAIEISAIEKENSIIVEYRDNGNGIEEDILPKIFDPFFTTDKFSGTGLGLNIIFNLIHQKLNGTVKCISEPGKGVLFVIQVPSKTN